MDDRYLTRLERDDANMNLHETLGEFLELNGYSKKFSDDFMVWCAQIPLTRYFVLESG